MSALDSEALAALLAAYLRDQGLYTWAMPLVGFIFWLVIFAVGLKDIDGSHVLSALVYITFCAGAGVILVLALPKKLSPTEDWQLNFLAVGVFSSLAIFAWERARKQAKRKRVKQLREEKLKREENGQE